MKYLKNIETMDDERILDESQCDQLLIGGQITSTQITTNPSQQATIHLSPISSVQKDDKDSTSSCKTTKQNNEDILKSSERESGEISSDSSSSSSNSSSGSTSSSSSSSSSSKSSSSNKSAKQKKEREKSDVLSEKESGKLDVLSEDFDPLAALYCKDLSMIKNLGTPEQIENAPTLDNVEVFAARYERKNRNGEKMKKDVIVAETSSKILSNKLDENADVPKRQFTAEQMPIEGTVKEFSNVVKFMEKQGERGGPMSILQNCINTGRRIKVFIRGIYRLEYRTYVNNNMSRKPYHTFYLSKTNKH